MQEKDFYLYIDGQPVQVSGEVYREYYRAEDKERYFMGKLKKLWKNNQISFYQDAVLVPYIVRGFLLPLTDIGK